MLILQTIKAQKVLSEVEIGKHLVVVAQPGVSYRVIDTATGKPPLDLVLKKKGQDLLVEDAQVEIVKIDHFYGQPQAPAAAATSTPSSSTSPASLWTPRPTTAAP